MRVIKRVDPEIKVKCPHCTSTLGVGKDDIKRGSVVHQSDRETAWFADCPVCSSGFRLNEDKIPYGWK